MEAGAPPPPPQAAYGDNSMPMPMAITSDNLLHDGSREIPEIPSLFFGNLDYGATVGSIRAIFEKPLSGVADNMVNCEVEKVDLKRGFCFVYIKQNFKSIQERDAVYNYAQRLHGM